MPMNPFSAHPIAPIYGNTTISGNVVTGPSGPRPAAGATPLAPPPGAAPAPAPAAPSIQQQLWDEWNRATNEATLANENRYNDILSGYKDRYSQAMSSLQGLGNQARADIATTWQNRASGGMQDLVSRGLANTSILPSMRQSYTRGEMADKARLEESLRREQLGYQTGLSSDLLQFMERRNDGYPGLDQFIQLSQALGAAGPGGVGGVGGASGGQGPYFFNATNGPLAWWQQQGGSSTPAPTPAPNPNLTPSPGSSPIPGSPSAMTTPRPGTQAANHAPPGWSPGGIQLSAADERAIQGLSDEEKLAYFKMKGMGSFAT